jgi:hypothetical protein
MMDASEIVLTWTERADGHVFYTAAALDTVMADRDGYGGFVPRDQLPGVAEWAAGRTSPRVELEDGWEPYVGETKGGEWVEWEPPWPAPPVPGEAPKP